MTYDCNVDELRKLMEARGGEAVEKIKTDYGTTDELCRRLHSDPQNGLSGDTADLNQRRATFGRNELPLPALPLDTTSEEYAREKQYCELQEKIQSEQNLAVMRGGQSIQINVREIVVGDVLQVKSGDLIPADGIVLQSNDLKLDESPVTGETDHIKKSPNTDPMLLAGTHVIEGSGKALVTGVGANSQTGIIVALLATYKFEE